MKASPDIDSGQEKLDMEIKAAKPIVAIIGRQNVGKSTLLNRLVGRRLAIVADLPGTTRDRIFADINRQGTEFTLVDTGGLELKADSDMTQAVNEQVKTAIIDADIIVFLVDAKDGVTATDLEIADLLRTSQKPLLLVANKVDNERLENEAVEFFTLGLGEPLPISAYHGLRTNELLDKIALLLPSAPPITTEPDIMKLAIIGRPNVGKSMLLNTIAGGERAIVSPFPGTTRDAIDTLLDFEGQSVLFIDTAGIRRRGRIGTGVEHYSVLRSLKAIDRADIALLLLDATELVTAQDLHIAGYIQQAAKGVVLLVNKWDIAKGLTKEECTSYIKSKFRFMPYASLLFISAKLGQGVDEVIKQAFKVYTERFKRIPTAEVNSVIQQAVSAHNPPQKSGRRLKLLYATPADTNPPTFVFFVNDTRLMHFSFQRYLENKLRSSFGFDGTPLRLVFKTRGEK
ncbi:MAG: ribosome biogenesis GTPase Der [Dehalococcoidales bacterium]|nr:ribosome biogenesis GTPase Der [Dehalococcoidales bacterium]